eukprot:9490710-Pyramimonas_sp.AAC.1
MRYMWECIDKELSLDSTIAETLSMDPTDRPKCVLDVPTYTEHPLVQRAVAAGEPPPLPLGIYLDGIRYISQAAGRSDT